MLILNVIHQHEEEFRDRSRVLFLQVVRPAHINVVHESSWLEFLTSRFVLTVYIFRGLI